MEKEKTPIPKWLKNLQENSWELELLISGGAIFSLFQFSDLWLNWINTLKITSTIPGTSIFLIIGMFGIKLLTIGFVLHLSFRAFWLAMVCINFVYPEGINKNKIKLKRPLNVTFKDGSDLHNPIMAVDKLCGTVMFMSITYAFLLIGLLFTLLCIITIPLILFEDLNNVLLESVIEYTLSVMFVGFLIYLVDLVLFGFLRKIPYLTYLLFPFFKFYDWISFRVVYRRGLMLLHTNINKSKLLAFTTIFLLFAACFTYLSIYRIMHWPNVFDNREYKWNMAENEFITPSWYRDNPNFNKAQTITLQSKLIKDNYLDVFVLYKKHYDFIINDFLPYTHDSMFTSIIKIKLDGKPLNNLDWHPTWGEDIDQVGVTTMIPLREYNNGKHVLSIWNPSKAQFQEIPFWKDVTD